MRFFILFLGLFPFVCFSQETLELTEIMKGHEFVGHLPTQIGWSADSKEVYFKKANKTDSDYFSFSIPDKSIDTISKNSKWVYPNNLNYSKSRDLFYILKEKTLFQVKQSGESEPLLTIDSKISNIQHVLDQNKVFFQIDQDFYAFDVDRNYFYQVSKLISDRKSDDSEKEETYLQQQEKELFIDRSKGVPRNTSSTNIASIPTKGMQLQSLQISPSEKHLIYRISKRQQPPYTDVMHFLSEDGFAKVQKARPKVGTVEPPEMKIGVYSFKDDTTFTLDLSFLEGLRKAPSYYSIYGRSDSLEKDKALIIHEVDFSPDGQRALISVKSFDNKDRWLLSYQLNENSFTQVDHQHDEAWIGGPGISGWNYYKGNVGWINNETVYFQSEESGFSHLYSFNVEQKERVALTKGNWEVYEANLSKDKKTFYITCNKTHPGNRSFYHLTISSKKLTPILVKDGAHEVTVSPDEKWLAIRYSYMNKPWELYIAQNTRNTVPKQITHSTNSSFDAIHWQTPEIVKIPTENGLHSNARLYTPDSLKKNGAAVIFVHGAGYLQNAHHYWSAYFREYMFHHILLEEGYTVLDIDYRASKGYGRDHRTAIYRHMGNADLEDQLHGKKWLVDKLNIDPERVGIYGGSYGGFITLMALLKHPGEFKCGGALRSVTDWAHYNHPYTSNILNTPELDSIAYRRSSPIYFAEGLEDRLIMFHGMVDDNVQYQDIIRLSQRFIELGKENWDLASYPIEPHSFQTASSWTDEYRRLLKMFNNQLLK